MSKTILPCLFLFMTFAGHSQNLSKTPYQKKVEDLKMQFYKEIGFDPKDFKTLESFNSLTDEHQKRDFLLLHPEISQKLSSDKAVWAAAELKDKIKDAVKLKTADDFKLESDYWKLKLAIKQQFAAWLKQTEFETNSDNEKRIRDSSKAELDKITENSINASLKKYLFDNFGGSYDFSERAKLTNYNAESETFQVEFYKKGLKINTIAINVPKKNASSFKNYFAKNYNKMYILSANMIDNNWTPKKCIIIFSNQYDVDNICKYTVDRWGFRYEITEDGDNNYELKMQDRKESEKLKKIEVLFQLNNTDTSVNDPFYFEWTSKASPQTLNFTYKDLGIELPYKN